MIEREKERQRERQKERYERKREREIERQTDTDRQTERETERGRETEREKKSKRERGQRETVHNLHLFIFQGHPSSTVRLLILLRLSLLRSIERNFFVYLEFTLWEFLYIIIILSYNMYDVCIT